MDVTEKVDLIEKSPTEEVVTKEELVELYELKGDILSNLNYFKKSLESYSKAINIKPYDS